MKKFLVLLWAIVAAMIFVSASGGFTIRSAKNPTGTLDAEGHLLVIDRIHQEVHDGHYFTVTRFQSASPDASSINIAFTTTTKEAHIFATSFSVGAASFILYEGVTTSGGSAATAINNNRTLRTASTVTLKYSPSHSPLTSTMLLGTSMVAAGSSPATKVIGEYSNNSEYVLKKNTTYLFRLTNQSGSASNMQIGIGWYEE